MITATHPNRPPTPPVVANIWVASDTVQLEALVAACALVAHADGWVTYEERGGTLARMRRLEATALFGVQRALVAFEDLLARFDQDPTAATERAHAAIARLQGHTGPSQLLVEAACSIAIADGAFDEAEREAILDICDLLDVDPQAYGIVAPGGPG